MSLHQDILFRYTCPDCDQINAPVIELYEFETEGIAKVTCLKCKRKFDIQWELKVSAEMVDEEIDVEGMIWDDDDEEDDIDFNDDDDGDDDPYMTGSGDE